MAHSKFKPIKKHVDIYSRMTISNTRVTVQPQFQFLQTNFEQSSHTFLCLFADSTLPYFTGL